MKNVVKTLVLMLLILMVGCTKDKEKTYYKVTYEFNNGEKNITHKIEKDDYLEEMDNPIKEGYIFLYWDYEGEKYNFNNPVAKDMVLKAIWEKEIVIEEVTSKPVVIVKPVQNTIIALKDILINSEEVNLIENETYSLEVKYLPSNATNKKLYYSTSNSSIVEIHNGVIKAVGVGTANVTISTENGIKKVCKVTVMSDDDYIIRDRTLIIQKVGIYDESKLEDLLYDEIIINTIPLTNNEDDRKIILDGVIAPLIESNVDDISLEIRKVALDTKLIINGKNNTINSLEDIKEVEVNNDELKLELPNLADITVGPDVTFKDFTYNINSKLEMMSNSLFTTYYNKYLSGDVILDSNIETQAISGVEYELDNDIYYVAVGTYKGDVDSVTEVSIGDTAYDKTPKMLNIGNNAYIYAPVWKIDNGIFYVAYPWLNVHNKENITNIKIDTINYKVKVFKDGNIKVENVTGLNTIDGYKNDIVVEENHIDYTTEHKDHELGITLSDDETTFNTDEYLIIKNDDSVSLGQVGEYTYIIPTKEEGEVTSEETYSNEYTIVVVNNGVTNIIVDVNLNVKTTDVPVDNLNNTLLEENTVGQI